MILRQALVNCEAWLAAGMEPTAYTQQHHLSWEQKLQLSGSFQGVLGWFVV